MKFKKHLLLIVILVAALLRVVYLDRSPAGLNADEAALGYNAYSLIKTGADEHGISWPLVFRSFDDYKPPLYVYLVLPLVYLFGLSTFVVRLPSAILGVATIYLSYHLANLLFPKTFLTIRKQKLSIGLFTAALITLSPWHLHFSRGAWEVNASLFFLTLGVYAFVRAAHNHPRWYLTSAISLVTALYTYHSIRLIAPIVLFLAVIIYHQKILKQFKSKTSRNLILTAFVIGAALSLPLAKQMLSKEGQSRFSGVSIFADSGPLWEALEKRRLSPDPDSLLTRLRYNRYLSYSKRFAQNYLSHYSPNFLFIEGDEIARSKVPGMGQSFLILAPFYLLGFILLLTKREEGSRLTLAWLLIAPIAAALTFQSPHALRSQNMVVPFNLAIALGIITIFNWISNTKPKATLIIFTLLSLLVLQNFVSYLKRYYLDYPNTYPFAWQYGFDQLADYIAPIQDQYQTITISDRYDQPYILVAFFLKYDPISFQRELIFSDRDNYGFSTGRAFSNFQFHKIDWQKDSENPDSLVVVADENVPADKTPIHTIYYPNGDPVFRIYSTSN